MSQDLTEHDLLAQLSWVRRIALALARDEAGADDLLQETWLVAAKQARRPRGTSEELRRWLGGVVRNVARRARRDDERRRVLEGSGELSKAGGSQRRDADLGDTLARAELHHDLTAAVLALPDAYRTPVLLRYIDGLSGPEVAARLGITPAAARQRLARGLEQLRAALDARHGGDRATWLRAIPLAWLELPSGTAHVTLTWGALTMKTKIVAALAVACAALIWFGSKVPSAEPHGVSAESSAVLERPAPRSAPILSTKPADEVGTRVAANASLVRALRLVDVQGAAIADALILVETHDAWRALGQTDFAGALALPESWDTGAMSDSDAFSFALARADLRATRFAVERADLRSSPGRELRCAVPTGAEVRGWIRTVEVPGSMPVRLDLACNRALATDPSSTALHQALLANGLAPDRLRAEVVGDRFRFAGLALDWSGALHVPPGWRIMGASDGVATDRPNQRALLLAPVEGLELVLAPPKADVIEVQGRVVEQSTGAPIDGAKVTVTHLGGDGTVTDASGHAFTDTEGHYRFSLEAWRADVPDAVLSLRVKADGYGTSATSTSPSSYVRSGRVRDIELRRRGDTQQSAESAARHAVLRVVVQELGAMRYAELVRVRVRAVESGEGDDGIVENLWHLRPDSGSPGKSTTHGGHIPLGAEVELAAVDGLGAPLANASVTITTDEVVVLNVPESEQGQPRSGLVTDTGGKPLPGAIVWLVRSNLRKEIISDADGHFKFPRSAAIEDGVELTVQRPGYVRRVVTPLVLPPGNGEFSIALDAARNVEVELVDARGEALTSAYVNARFGDDLQWTRERTTPGSWLFTDVPSIEGVLIVKDGDRTHEAPVNARVRKAQVVVPWVRGVVRDGGSR